MTTTKITKEQLNIFVLAGKAFVSNSEESELTEAVEALLDPGIKKLKKIEREKDVIRLKLCKKTGSKHIERDRYGNLQYTEADNLELLKQLDDIEQQQISFPTDIVEDFSTEGLSYDTRMAFEGIVIPKIDRKFDNLPEEEEEAPAKEPD